MLTLFFLFLPQLLFATFFFFLCLAFLTGGPFVPSRRKVVQAMVYIARIKPGTTIYDLGSGDGRILFAAARRGATAIGYEINPLLALWTRLRAYFSPYRNTIGVRWKNLWKADLTYADVVFLYLLPMSTAALRGHLRRTLKPGAWVVTNTFLFSNWKPIRRDPTHHVYAYRV